jgi:replicative DNA helicase
MEKIAKLRDSSKPIEKSIISGLIQNPKKIVMFLKEISADDFSNERARRMFSLIKECVEKNQDILTRISETDLTYSEFIDTDFRNIDRLPKELKQISQAIKINTLLQKWTGAIDNRNIGQSLIYLMQDISRINSASKTEKTDVKNIINEFIDEQEMYAEKYKSGKKLLGLDCGFKEINGIIDGLRSGHFWIIGGYNNSGKTFFALNIVNSLLMDGKRVVIYSMEMSKLDIVGRLMGMIAGMNSYKILKGVLTEEQSSRELEAKGKLYESKLDVYQNLDDYEEIKMSMYEEDMREKVDLFVIDYLQLLKNPRMTEYQLMTDASREFQSIGKKTGIPIIALSQISNETAKNPNQSVGGFKGSGGIEASSDLSIKLVQLGDIKEIQEKQSKGVPINIDLIITKNRHGIKGAFPMSFDGYTGRFYSGHETKI